MEPPVPLTLCVLASGSSGNATYVASGSTRLLIDAGLSARQTEARLAMIGVSLDSVSALCVTHEHGDHTAGILRLHRRTSAPVYANAGTIEALERASSLGIAWQVFTTGQSFRVGDLTVHPFSVPHDSYDPVGFAIEADGGGRVGVATDMGVATVLVRERLRDCAAMVVEANHDEQMLRDADRPWSLKQRIAGRQGHLSNRQAGELVAELAGTVTRVVFLSHLSSDCNRPEAALGTVTRILADRGLGHIAVKLTYPDRPSECVVV
jgi:phosphoribosyl 1,2-cyclic phosphodiesterase